MGCSESKSTKITVLPKGATPEKAPPDYRKKNQYPIPVVLPPSRSNSEETTGVDSSKDDGKTGAAQVMNDIPKITFEEATEDHTVEIESKKADVQEIIQTSRSFPDVQNESEAKKEPEQSNQEVGVSKEIFVEEVLVSKSGTQMLENNAFERNPKVSFEESHSTVEVVEVLPDKNEETSENSEAKDDTKSNEIQDNIKPEKAEAVQSEEGPETSQLKGERETYPVVEENQVKAEELRTKTDQMEITEVIEVEDRTQPASEVAQEKSSTVEEESQIVDESQIKREKLGIDADKAASNLEQENEAEKNNNCIEEKNVTVDKAEESIEIKDTAEVAVSEQDRVEDTSTIVGNVKEETSEINRELNSHVDGPKEDVEEDITANDIEKFKVNTLDEIKTQEIRTEDMKNESFKSEDGPTKSDEYKDGAMIQNINGVRAEENGQNEEVSENQNVEMKNAEETTSDKSTEVIENDIAENNRGEGGLKEKNGELEDLSASTLNGSKGIENGEEILQEKVDERADLINKEIEAKKAEIALENTETNNLGTPVQ